MAIKIYYYIFKDFEKIRTRFTQTLNIFQKILRKLHLRKFLNAESQRKISFLKTINAEEDRQVSNK